MHDWDQLVIAAATSAADLVTLDASDPETVARAFVAKCLNR